MTLKNCVLLPACCRQRNGFFSPHIHGTWGPPFSASQYIPALLSGAPYPALFDMPVVTSDGVYDLSWRVNCSTPVISYELEFRELPHGNWVSLNVPGCANSHSDM